MKKGQGKISMRLFKKEKVHSKTKSTIIVDEQSIQKKFTNQLEILFDPIFEYQINERLSFFFKRWDKVLSIYEIKKAFYQINDIGFITLYISFGVDSLLNDVEIKQFFQTVQELLTEPYPADKTIETNELLFQPLNKHSQFEENKLNKQGSTMEDVQDELLIKKWSENQAKEHQVLMEQLDSIEQENKLLQENLDRIGKGNYSSLIQQKIPTVKNEDNQVQPYSRHQSSEYQQKFNILSQELVTANKLISELEHNNMTLTSTLEQVSETKNTLYLKEGKQSKEISNLTEQLIKLENENQQLKDSLDNEQSEKMRLFEQLQSDTREFESTITYQEQQLVISSTTKFKMQAEIDELMMEKNEQNILMQELILEKDSVQNELDQVLAEKESVLQGLEELKISYWELEKKLKEWIEKCQIAETTLKDERSHSEMNQSSLTSDMANLRKLNLSLSEENTYYQNEMSHLLKETDRLSERVNYLQQLIDQRLIEEQDEIFEDSVQMNESIEIEKRKKRYDEQGILKLFQKADDADTSDVKVLIEDYREYRLSLKFLEYRWYQANIMQMAITGESELGWSQVYLSKVGEFFEDLENLIKTPLLSKKYVIMNKEVLLRLKAYQALSDYLERRYIKSSKHIFDRETNE